MGFLAPEGRLRRLSRSLADDSRLVESTELLVAYERLRKLSAGLLHHQALGRSRVFPTRSPEGADAVRRPSKPPVFVIGTGWRTGSTAVQRLVTSSEEVFIWGEPFTMSRVPARLAQIALEGGAYDPYQRFTVDPAGCSLAWHQEWMAIAQPDPSWLIPASRRFLEALYWSPLAHGDYQTWGVKEVAASPRVLAFLSLCFPEARWIAVTRHPINSYLSFRTAIGIAPYMGQKWPADRLAWAYGPRTFGRVWAGLSGHVLTSLPPGRSILVRLEDVRSPQFAREVASLINSEVAPGVWESVVRGTSRAPSAGGGVIVRGELHALWRVVRDQAEQLGYGVDRGRALVHELPST